MGDLLSFLYTVVDTLSLIFFLDAFAQRRWDNRLLVIQNISSALTAIIIRLG